MLKHRPDTTLAPLENRCTRERTVGSNPTPSASFFIIDDVVQLLIPGGRIDQSVPGFSGKYRIAIEW